LNPISWGLIIDAQNFSTVINTPNQGSPFGLHGRLNVVQGTLEIQVDIDALYIRVLIDQLIGFFHVQVPFANGCPDELQPQGVMTILLSLKWFAKARGARVYTAEIGFSVTWMALTVFIHAPTIG
jgi:hypothetical protein